MLKLLIINFLYFLLYTWDNFYAIFGEVITVKISQTFGFGAQTLCVCKLRF